MEINEILQRPSPAYYTQDEIVFAVEKYIEKKKGVRVKIDILKKYQDLDSLNPFGIFTLQKEYENLWKAFDIVQQNYNK